MQDDMNCRGTMVSVRASAEKVNAAIAVTSRGNEVAVAAVNGSKSVVVSGSESGVKRVLEQMGSVVSVRVDVAHAFHSPLVGSVLPEYRRVLARV